MKPRSNRFYALVAFAVVALIGAAFINQGVSHGLIKEQLNTLRSGQAAAQALERTLGDVAGALAKVDAARAGKEPLPLRAAADSAGQRPGVIERFVLAENGRVVASHPAGTSAAEFADADDWRSDSWLAAPRRSPAGRMQLLLHRPGSAGAAADTQVGAVANLDALLEAVGLNQLAADGYEYRLSVARAAGALNIARSIEGELDAPVEHSFVFWLDRWTLAVAPRNGGVAWRWVALQIVMVFALALAAGLVALDLAKERGLVRKAAEKQQERLSAAKRQLVEEIQQREELERQFSHASFHDSVTGLPNRRYLVTQLKQNMHEARTRGGVRLAIMVLELERFDAMSDSIGAWPASHLLTLVARRLEQALDKDPRWVMATLREAQFAFSSSDFESREAVMVMAEKLHQSLAEPCRLGGQVLFVKAHLGLAFSASGYDHPDDLLRGAQIALARARQESSRLAEFTHSAQEQLITRHQLEVDLHQVVERGELRLNFQPIVSLTTGRIAGFEVLVRWFHPLEGVVPPSMFIGLAEETGLITPITRWVLREACQQAEAWRKELPAGVDFYFSVNLSGQDMRQPDLGDYIENLLHEVTLAEGMLRLELTEGSMINDVRAAVDLITRLRARGVKILLDDFGTGYSSLSYLQRFQIDYIKIDQSFVGRLTPDQKSSGIVRAIMHLAEGMSIKTVAEGIETAEAMQLLKELKCEYGQGYYFSRPVDAAAAWQLLVERHSWAV